MRLFRFASVLTLLALLLAACGAEQITAEEIMRRMQEARANLQSGHVVANVAINSPERDGTLTVEAWGKKTGQNDAAGEPIAKTRVEVKQASEPDLTGTVLVSDGTTFWLYNPKENKVVTGNRADLENKAGGAQDRVGQMMQLQEMLQRILDGSDVVIESQNEQVAGRAAWKVKLTPKPETQEQLQIGSVVETHLWVDQQSYLPVKAQIDAQDLGGAMAEATTLDLNGAVDDSLFTFTPPAGAEVINAADLIKQATPETVTLDDARKQAGFPVLAPTDLPQGVTLDEVQVLNRGGKTVIQNYSGAVNFSLVQAQGGFPGDDRAPAGAKTTTVTVRGQQATLITGGGGANQGTLLRWQENGVTIVIAGTLSQDQATGIAASLK